MLLPGYSQAGWPMLPLINCFIAGFICFPALPGHARLRTAWAGPGLWLFAPANYAGRQRSRQAFIANCHIYRCFQARQFRRQASTAPAFGHRPGILLHLLLPGPAAPRSRTNPPPITPVRCSGPRSHYARPGHPQIYRLELSARRFPFHHFSQFGQR